MAYCSGPAVQKMRPTFANSSFMMGSSAELHGVWMHPQAVDPSMRDSHYSRGNLSYQFCYPPQPHVGYVRGCHDVNYYHHVPYHPPAFHHSHLPIKNHQNFSFPNQFDLQANSKHKQNNSRRKHSFSAKNQESKKNELEHKTPLMRGPLREWRLKVPSVRYDSDDSGIAESPNSMTSSMTWHSYDEPASDVDECTECFDQKLSIDERDGDSTEASSDKKRKNFSAEEELYWSVSDDANFWLQLRHKPPSNYVMNRIVDQVEYYLSDEYLLKDKYLLRQIRCKKDGYVSIKLITSFKKVKKLTQDWAVVRSAIVRRSSKLVVSSEGLRIKRKEELSEGLKQPRLLTSVLVIRLPEEYNAVDRVTSLFSGFGEIGFVRLLRADKSIPADLRNYATQVPDIGKSLCAVVDFELAEDSLKAVRVFKFIQRQTSIPDQDSEAKEDMEIIAKHKDMLKGFPSLGDMRLALLGPRVRRTLYRQDRASESLDQTRTSESFEHAQVSASLDDDTFTETTQQKTASKPEDQISSLHREHRQNIARSPRTRRLSSKVYFSDTKGTMRLLHLIRQPKGPGNDKGFKKIRSIRSKQ